MFLFCSDMIVASRARSKLSLARRKVPAENYRSENRNYRNKYSRSSVLPAQKPQILRKFLRICQLFNNLWQRPQDQRPISLAFIWQLMDQIIRFFRIYSHVKHILHSTDTKETTIQIICLVLIFPFDTNCVCIFLKFREITNISCAKKIANKAFVFSG